MNHKNDLGLLLAQETPPKFFFLLFLLKPAHMMFRENVNLHSSIT